MRLTLVLVAGLMLGVVLTFGYVDLTGGWYVYGTIPSLGTGRCMWDVPNGVEIVPNQPNPCHFRRPRW